METVVDLEPEALERARTLAAERGETIGKVLSDALLGHHAGMSAPEARIEVDERGWPQIRVGRSFTSEDVKTVIAEDETRETTRGDPQHPFHKPVLTTDEQGFPQVEIGRPLTLEEVRAAIEEE